MDDNPCNFNAVMLSTAQRLRSLALILSYVQALEPDLRLSPYCQTFIRVFPTGRGRGGVPPPAENLLILPPPRTPPPQ